MKNKNTSSLEAKLEKVDNLLGHLIAVQMYRGGAWQREIAKSLSMSLSTVNKFVKVVKAPKENHGEK